MAPNDPASTPSARFDYYMLRVHRSEHDPERVDGLIERLGTGEKRSFHTREQLVALVIGWQASNPNLRPGDATGNASARGANTAEDV